MALVIGAAIVRDGRLLAARRSRPEDLAGGWELPGGKVEAGETPEEAVVREVGEELGCRIAVSRILAQEQEIRPGLTLVVALARLLGGEPVPRADEHDAVRWLGADQLDEVGWLEADRPFLPALGDALRDEES